MVDDWLLQPWKGKSGPLKDTKTRRPNNNAKTLFMLQDRLAKVLYLFFVGIFFFFF